MILMLKVQDSKRRSLCYCIVLFYRLINGSYWEKLTLNLHKTVNIKCCATHLMCFSLSAVCWLLQRAWLHWAPWETGAGKMAATNPKKKKKNLDTQERPQGYTALEADWFKVLLSGGPSLGLWPLRKWLLTFPKGTTLDWKKGNSEWEAYGSSRLDLHLTICWDTHWNTMSHRGNILIICC